MINLKALGLSKWRGGGKMTETNLEGLDLGDLEELIRDRGMVILITLACLLNMLIHSSIPSIPHFGGEIKLPKDWWENDITIGYAKK
jgi:hypothetical protein